jgi:hypothetical protein
MGASREMAGDSKISPPHTDCDHLLYHLEISAPRLPHVHDLHGGWGWLRHRVFVCHYNSRSFSLVPAFEGDVLPLGSDPQQHSYRGYRRTHSDHLRKRYGFQGRDCRHLCFLPSFRTNL